MKSTLLRQIIQKTKSIFGERLVDITRKTLINFTTLYLKATDKVLTYQDIVKSENVIHINFSERQKFELTQPEYYNKLPEEISGITGKHHSSKPFVITVPNATLQVPEGHICMSNGQYLVYNFGRTSKGTAAKSLAYDFVIGISHGSIPPLRNAGESLTTYEHAFSLLSPHSSNYTHWTQECLTRLEALEVYINETDERPTILLPPDPPEFVYESIETLGYSNEEYVEVTGERISVDRLVVPSPRRFLNKNGDGWLRMVDAFNWVRDQAIAGITTPDSDEYSSRILISREDATTRRIVNRNEVINKLADRGFEKYVPGEMTYNEQVRLFSQADVIVGAHGAGMINAIYATDASVLELYGSHYLPANYELAQGQQRPYGCLQCEPVDKDFRVDIDDLMNGISVLEAAR